jgi:ABC-type multidrug transport system ATPase subunit
MPFSLSLKSLIRLQNRQLLAWRTKRDLIGPLIMLVSSHNLTSINDLCDRLLLLEKGHLLMDMAHVPDSVDPELESYFLDAVK